MSNSFLNHNQSPSECTKSTTKPIPKSTDNVSTESSCPSQPDLKSEQPPNETTLKHELIESLTRATLRYLDKNEDGVHSKAEESVFTALGYDVSTELEKKENRDQGNKNNEHEGISSEEDIDHENSANTQPYHNYNKQFLDKIEEIRIEHIMRYRDAIRAFRLQQTFKIINKLHPTFSRNDIIIYLTSKANALFLPSPSPPPPPINNIMMNKQGDSIKNNVENMDKHYQRIKDVKENDKIITNNAIKQKASINSCDDSKQNGMITTHVSPKQLCGDYNDDRNKYVIDGQNESKIYISINNDDNSKNNNTANNFNIISAESSLNREREINTNTIQHKQYNKTSKNTVSSTTMLNVPCSSSNTTTATTLNNSAYDNKSFVLSNIMNMNDEKYSNDAYFNELDVPSSSSLILLDHPNLNRIVSYSTDPVLQKIALQKKKSRKRKFATISMQNEYDEYNPLITDNKPPKKRSRMDFDPNRMHRNNRHHHGMRGKGKGKGRGKGGRVKGGKIKKRNNKKYGLRRNNSDNHSTDCFDDEHDQDSDLDIDANIGLNNNVPPAQVHTTTNSHL